MIVEITVALIGAAGVIVSTLVTTNRKTRQVVRETRAEDSAEHDRVTSLIESVHEDVRLTNRLLFEHVTDRDAHPFVPIVPLREEVDA